jgi:hypothetical protein
VLLTEIPVSPRTPIPLFARGKRRADQDFQMPIPAGVWRLRPSAPGVITARRHARRRHIVAIGNIAVLA